MALFPPQTAMFFEGLTASPAQTNQILNGTIKFSGLIHRSAKYIIVKSSTIPKKILLEMTISSGTSQDNSKWNLTKPKLILSITGSNKKLNLSSKMKKLIKRGLTKVCESTRSWVVTNGSDAGVSKMIGEGLAESHRFSEIVSIGVISMNRVACACELISMAQQQHHSDDRSSANKPPPKAKTYYGVKEDPTLNQNIIFLDHNHSYFVLADTSNEDDENAMATPTVTGVENNDKFSIEQDVLFRVRLEREMRLSWSASKAHLERSNSHGQDSERHSLSSWGSSDAAKNDFNLSTTTSVVPSILVCIGGQFESLLMVKESLREKVSVLIFAGTKGCADLIADALSNETPNVKDLIQNSKIFDKQTQPSQEKLQAACDCLSYIIKTKKNNSELVHVFRLDDEERELGEEDIECEVLKTFINSQKYKYYDNLKLTLQWNSIRFARKIFNGEEYLNRHQHNKLLELAIVENKPEFVELFIENGTNLDNFLSYGRLYYLYNAKKIHMQSKRAPLFELVKSEYSVNQESYFITFKKIKTFLKANTIEEIGFDFLPIDLHFCLHQDSSVLMQIKSFLNEKYEKENLMPLVIDHESDVSYIFQNLVDHPIQNLFLWAVLLNRIEIAKIFWQIGQNQIPNALFASILLESLSSASSQKTDLLKTSNEFVEMSVGLINMFDAELDDESNYTNLLDEVSIFGLNCLQMAVIGNRKKFVATALVQNLLTQIWNGKVTSKTDMITRLQIGLCCITFGILAPFLAFERKSIKSNNYELAQSETEHQFLRYLSPNMYEEFEERIGLRSGNRQRTHKSARRDRNIREKIYIYWSRYVDFFYSPRVNFIYDAGAYLMFLMIFSYYMLCEFSFYEDVSENYWLPPSQVVAVDDRQRSDGVLNPGLGNVSNDSSIFNMTTTKPAIKNPTRTTYLLIFWIFSFIMEEIRQYVFGDSQINWRIKLIRYLRDSWNYLDILGCFFFSSGMSLAFLALRIESEDLFMISKILLCVDLIVWYLRLLHVSLVFKSLGPKLVMIQKMIKDLLFFMSLVSIFVCAYGVTTEAAMYPNSKLDLDLIRRVVTKAYWPIYGTIKILDDFDRFDSNCSAHNDCPDNFSFSYSYLLLMIYMVIANVLLVNLLIAMFSNTFQRVQDNADEIWKYQRYWLVYEYVDTPLFPPPLNMLSYIFNILRLNVLKLIHWKFEPAAADKTHDGQHEKDLEKMHLYDELERRFAERYLDMKQDEKEKSTEKQLALAIEKLETLEQKFNNFFEIQQKNKKKARKMESHL